MQGIFFSDIILPYELELLMLRDCIMNETPILESRVLSKIYHDGQANITVLHAIDFSVYAGQRIAIIGPSGSGKSTLLHMLGGLDKPTHGSAHIYGKNWWQLNEKQRCQGRNQFLGFIYQFHHLLPEFTALENVAMPLLLAKQSVKYALQQAAVIIENVGLSHRSTHLPSQLSGGERQRVAIARALVTKPVCIIADEPTGNLDQTTASVIFELLVTLNQQLNTALVIVTHDHRLAAKMDNKYTLLAGKLIESR